MAGVLRSVTDGLTISRYSDWLIFVERLQELVRLGKARKIPPSRRIWVQDEEWYLDAETGDVYVYVSPDAPILPIWEKVDIFAPPQKLGTSVNNLSVIPQGYLGRIEAHSTKVILESLIRQGAVEKVCVNDASVLPKETWYRDKETGITYRLVEGTAEDTRWERVPQTELNQKTQ